MCDNDHLRRLFLLLLVVVVCLTTGFFAGRDWGRGCERRVAIEAGVGKWVVDPQSGVTEFRYGAP